MQIADWLQLAIQTILKQSKECDAVAIPKVVSVYSHCLFTSTIFLEPLLMLNATVPVLLQEFVQPASAQARMGADMTSFEPETPLQSCLCLGS